MKMLQSGALTLVLLAAAGAAPALAATTEQGVTLTNVDQTQSGAYRTQVPSFVYTPRERTMAAVRYMNDAMALLDSARMQLQDPRTLRQGQAALMAASGKLTDAYLYKYNDRHLRTTLFPLSVNAEQALGTATRDPRAAVAMIDTLRPQLASLYDTQLATVGGGAGAGWEPLAPRQPASGTDQD